MTKDRLMLYTFGALLAVTIVTAILWFPITTIDLVSLDPYVANPNPINLGLTVIICALISIGISVGVDALLHKLAADSPLNPLSAAVFGLIVTDSYTLGVPSMNTEVGLPVSAPGAFIYVALISLIGMVLFKKVIGLAGRKYVNPAAASKFIVLLPSVTTTLIAVDHLKTSMLQVPALAGPIGWGEAPNFLSIGGNGLQSFAANLAGCFSNPMVAPPPADVGNILQLMVLDKFHGWAGGASSIAVIVAGIALFVLARRYIKWRITLSYFVAVALMSILMSLAFADQDILLRLIFTVFIGSSIFLAFFMATDPATTPLTYQGQAIFGVGLGVLTVLIQTGMNFFGGSILALLIMNLTVPALDKVGKLKPHAEKKEPKLPRAKTFTAVKEFQCIRCGACMRACCHKLSPILIKTAYDKTDVETLKKLHADLCEGCGHCTFICPARIDLRASILRAKVMVRQK